MFCGLYEEEGGCLGVLLTYVAEVTSKANDLKKKSSQSPISELFPLSEYKLILLFSNVHQI